MADRSKDWFAQAQRDLRHARVSLREGDHEWACFAAQQAAEKAVKAIFQRLGLDGWGHSVKQLLDTLAEARAVPADVRQAGLFLDRYYIPTRYPNGFAQGVPGEYFLLEDSERAIDHADRILAFAQGCLGL